MADAPRNRRWIAAAAGLALTLTGVLVAPPAVADTAPADPAVSQTVAADGLPTVQIDGVVWSQVVVGDIVYVAGEFTTARPAGAAPGVNTVPRYNLLAYDITTGVLVDDFAPQLNAQALSITASPDGSRVYVVGEFTQVDGQFRVRAAAFDTATGDLVPDFRPTLASSALTVAASETAVYIGGNFTSVAGVTGGTLEPRGYLAAFDPATGAVLPFRADADQPVTALAVQADRAKVVVGGRFLTLGGVAAVGLAAVDPTTGASLPFPAATYVRNFGTTSSITSLYADETGVYGSGYTFGRAGNLEGTFRADPTTGELVWLSDCHGDTYSVYPQDDVLYGVGHIHYCGNVPEGFPQTEPWSFHHVIAMTLGATGVNTPDIYGYPSHTGEPAPSILHLNPTFYTGTYTGQGQAGWSVAGNGEYLTMGGEFPGLNGASQQGLVRFAASDTAPNRQGPRLAGTDFPLRATSDATGEVNLAWSGNWDRDNETLTYRIFRASQASPAIHTRTVTEKYWLRPSMSFTDTGRTPGSTVQYRLTATDPFGNVAQSLWVSVVVAGSGSTSDYVQDVRGDEPLALWRLGEGAGPVLADAAGTNPLTASAGVAFAATGVIDGDADTAATFDGTTAGFAVSTVPTNAPDTFSVETWVQTTTTRGGKLIGFGNRATGSSNTTDRHLYMDNAGRITFGMRDTGLRTVTTPHAYNDGQWHHIVATYTDGTMLLYVDGALVGQRTGLIYERSYWGYWRVGGDGLFSWINRPSSDYLAGTLDEVAVYGDVLTAEQVAAHYTAAGRTITPPPVADDAYGLAVQAAAPLLYWRLGEGSGTLAQDSGPSDNDGSYRAGTTQGLPGALVDVPDTSVAFDGVAGLVSSNDQYVNPSTYSEELWFSSTSTVGGKLIGFGNAQTGLSTTYDRHVFLGADGRLSFGTYTGAQVTITSPSAYNDGAWHHVVASQDASGMRLYVDGALVAQGSNAVAQSYSGYWRVGGDTSWGTPAYIAATIDEVAVYPYALTPETVANHHALGTTGAPPNVLPVATFAASVADLAVAVDGSASSDADGTITQYAWTFGDGATATGPTASHTYAAAGTYPVTLTVTDDAGGTSAATQDVTVVADVPPTAAFTASVTDLAVAVDGSGSSDTDGTITQYAWTFGDGATATGPTAAHTYAEAGTYPVTLTVTDDAGGTGTLTQDVTVSEPLPVTEHARDAFGRTVVAGWGTAEVGGAWTVVGTATAYRVDGAAAAQVLPRAGATLTSSLASVATTDMDLQVTVALDKAQTGGGTYVSVVGRQVGTAGYAARLRFLATGAVSLSAMQGSTALSSLTIPGLTYAPGEQLRVRLQVTGAAPTTVRAKVWRAGQAEPAAWQVTATDATASLQVPGSVRLIGYLSGSSTNAPMTVTYDDLLAVPTVVGPPPPNVAPTAAFTVTATDLTAGVDGSGSTDPDGTVASWAWTFGDGATATGPTAAHAYAAAGTYPVTLTVTDDDGAVGTLVQDVTVTAPVPGTELARDAFGREVVGGWGAAEVGGAWTVGGTAASYAVTGGVGTQVLPRAGATLTSYLTGVASTATELRVAVALDVPQTGGGTYVSVVGRRVGTAEYSARLRFLATGAVTLAAMQGSTALASLTVPGLTYVPGEQLQVRLQVTGTAPTTIRAKVWRVGQPEPAAWQVSATDATTALQAPGWIGLTGYLSASSTNAPVTIAYDELVALPVP